MNDLSSDEDMLNSDRLHALITAATGRAATDGGVRDRLDLDSIETMQVLCLLEETYGIVFGDEELTRERFATADSLIELVNEKVSSTE